MDGEIQFKDCLRLRSKCEIREEKDRTATKQHRNEENEFIEFIERDLREQIMNEFFHNQNLRHPHLVRTLKKIVAYPSV